jgi:hypothetical protein
MFARVDKYLSGSPARRCSKIMSSVKVYWKFLLAVTTLVQVVLRKVQVFSIVVPSWSLNTVIFFILSLLACSQILLYFVYSWFQTSLAVAVLLTRSVLIESIQIVIV